MGTVRAYIGFGANLGDPIQQILNARRLLALQDGVFNLVNSSLYLTTPVGYEDQDDFVNCVSSVETDLSAQGLLEVLQSIENSLGRQRDAGNQNAPRLIDLDLLLFGDINIDDENLVVPHPRLTQRLFALEPLRELAPRLNWNGSGDVSAILKQSHIDGVFADQSIYRLT